MSALRIFTIGYEGTIVPEFLAALTKAGVERVIVAHGDLPLAGDLRWVARFPGVTIVPDHGDDGTNVISVPTAAPWLMPPRIPPPARN